jgi:CubicO group peptidase (beta-lactamase class C family)
MSSFRVWWIITVLAIVMLLLTGCGIEQTELSNTIMPTQQGPTTGPHLTQVLSEYWPTEGWRTSTPEEQGVDSVVLVAMMDAIQSGGAVHNIDSITIIRNGYIVLDITFYPFQLNSTHIIHSCTKSIISALVGIAIEQGNIESVQQPVLDLFPERTVANLTPAKEAMTLEDVLMMATGLKCQDSILYNWDGLYKMMESQDWVQFVLDLPMAEEPGTRFEYCNSASFLLSAIIQETTGMSALDFATENLFTPLGISDVEWPSNAQGITIGWGELNMKPHDMAKFGYLYLSGGVWEGKQIIPSSWVERSTRKHISSDGLNLEDGYGYQWWVDDSGIYMALGYAGQYIVVIPEQEMVVVFTSDLMGNDFFIPRELVDDYIIPAAISDTPLSANPNGVEKLQTLIQEAAGQP